MNNGRWSYLWYYALVFGATYVLRYPPLLLVLIAFFVLRRYVPDPSALARTFGRISTLRRTVTTNPANVTARRDLAMIYLQQRRPGAALSELTSALERFPRDAELLFLRGAALHMRGEYDAATAPLVASVSVDPRLRFGEPFLLAADCLLELGRNEEAIDAYDRFLTVNTSSVEGHVKKARAHRAMKESAASARELDEALKVWAQLPGFQRRTQFPWWIRAHLARLFT